MHLRSEFWRAHSGVHAGGGRGGGKQAGGGASAGKPSDVRGGGRSAVQASLLASLQGLCPATRMPTPAHVKMLNWRTSQVRTSFDTGGVGCVVVSGGAAHPQEPALVLAGDFCTESSFDGCTQSAVAAARAVLTSLEVGSDLPNTTQTTIKSRDLDVQPGRDTAALRVDGASHSAARNVCNTESKKTPSRRRRKGRSRVASGWAEGPM